MYHDAESAFHSFLLSDPDKSVYVANASYGQTLMRRGGGKNLREKKKNEVSEIKIVSYRHQKCGVKRSEGGG